MERRFVTSRKSWRSRPDGSILDLHRNSYELSAHPPKSAGARCIVRALDDQIASVRSLDVVVLRLDLDLERSECVIMGDHDIATRELQRLVLSD